MPIFGNVFDPIIILAHTTTNLRVGIGSCFGMARKFICDDDRFLVFLFHSLTGIENYALAPNLKFVVSSPPFL